MTETEKRIILDEARDHISHEAFFCMGANNELAYANSVFLRTFGYNSIDEYNQRPGRTIFADIEEEMTVLALLKSDSGVSALRILCKTSYGTFWGLLSCVRNGVDSFIGAVIDVTALVEHEGLLRTSSIALEKSNVELDRFIYSASHDIRAPISTVMGLVNVIYLETDPARQMDLVGMISQMMKKLDTFLHQLDLHSKNLHHDIRFSSLDLQGSVAKALTYLRDHETHETITVSTNIDIAESFNTDNDRITSALIHVLKNAFDFADPAKQEKKIDIFAQVVRGRLIIEVFDNGVGIPDERIANVFDLFYKGTTKSRGSGLGLFLVREVMTRLNGIASIHSKMGVGTLVRLEIPNAPVTH